MRRAELEALFAKKRKPAWSTPTGEDVADRNYLVQVDAIPRKYRSATLGKLLRYTGAEWRSLGPEP